jgi:hypothetical protein
LRTEALAVAGVTHASSAHDTDDIGGIGDTPLVITLELASGASVELAASSADGEVMVGPFSALPDQPS